MFDRDEFERWMAQASDTLNSARQDYSVKSYKLYDVLMDYSKAVSSKIGRFTGVLYGSMARGDYNLWSDIDFLVISDQLPENPLERLEFLYSLTDTPIEVKGYTRNEFLKMIEKRNPLALDAIVEGKVIADDGFWEVAKNKFEEVKKRYELVKEHKRWVSMRMKRSFLKEGLHADHK